MSVQGEGAVGSPEGTVTGPRYRVKPRMNWMAIASLVFGILGFSIIGAIIALTFGNLARDKIKETHQRGMGLAIAGITLAAAWMVLLVGGLVLRVVLAPHP